MSVLDKYSCEGQMSLFDPDTWCGRMFQVPSAQTAVQTSKPSLRKPQKWQKGMPAFLDLRSGGGVGLQVERSWEMGGQLLGEYTMRSFGECPSVENESLLSQILEEKPHPKYSLSARACQGILNRASRRGKKLPPQLEQALIRQATPLKSEGGREIDSKGHKAGKGALVQTELSGTLGVSQDQTLITNVDAMALEVFHCTSESEKVQTLKARDYKDPQCVVYGISAYDSNAMKSSNPNSGVYVADTTRTLDNNGGNPACNQGGMMVVQGFDSYNLAETGQVGRCLSAAGGGLNEHTPIVCLEGNGSRPSHKGDGYAESDTMYTLNSTEHHAVCVENHPADSRVQIKEDGVVQTLSGRMGTGGGNVPLLMDTYQKTTGALMASGYDKLGTQEAANDMYVVQSNWDGSQVAPTLTSNNANGAQRMPDKDNFNAVLTYGLDRASFNQGKNAQYDFAIEEEKIGTQVAKGPGAVCQSIVRRLTPMECERLQGFPDHWTDIGEWVDTKGKVHKDADSPRYKALGNSIALPFWQWMAGRMVSHLSEHSTMASLFDGIGGFPLVFSRCGCKPVWASEIEEFPIAVTKKRFSDM